MQGKQDFFFLDPAQIYAIVSPCFCQQEGVSGEKFPSILTYTASQTIIFSNSIRLTSGLINEDSRSKHETFKFSTVIFD